MVMVVNWHAPGRAQPVDRRVRRDGLLDRARVLTTTIKYFDLSPFE